MSYGWITGASNQTPIAPDKKQAMRRSPCRCQEDGGASREDQDEESSARRQAAPGGTGAAEVIEEAPPEIETEYMMVRPDATPPIVHVDPVAADPRVEHLQSELAAAGEENEQLKSIISDLKAQRVEDQNEIMGLRMSCERLESRARARNDEFAAFLLDHMGGNEDVQTLFDGAQKFIPEVFEAIQRVQAARQQMEPAA